MSIGTRVKVGFDGSAVVAGIKRIKGMFTGLGRTIGRIGRQTAIGGARAAGQSLVGLVVRGATAIPREINRLADYSVQLQTVARDAGVTTREVVAMQRAMELSGMSTDMAADTFREFATKMGEAAKDIESEPMKALRDLGIFQNEIRGQSVTRQMDMFAEKVKNFGGSQQDLAFIMDRFLGGDLGLRAISFFQNYNERMKDGTRLTGAYSDELERNAGRLRNWIRIRSAWQQKFSEFALAALGASPEMNSAMSAAFLENLPVAEYGAKFGEYVQRKFTEAMGIVKADGFEGLFDSMFSGLKDMVKDLGRTFGEGAKETLKPSNWFGFGKGGDDRSTSMLDGIESNTARMSDLLRRIERKPGGAVWA